MPFTPDKASSALLARANALLEIERYADAVALLLQLLASEPQDAPILCRLAFAHLKMGKRALAMQYVNASIGADPAEEWGHRLRSAILLEEKNIPEAVRAAEAAVACNPQGEQSLHALIKALLAAKQKERAEEVAAHLRFIAPDSVWAHDGSGLAAMHLLQWEKVEQHYCALLAIQPEIYSAHNNIGMARIHLGRYEEAIASFQEAARLLPTDKTIHQRIALARTYQRLQETQGLAPFTNIFGKMGSSSVFAGIKVKSAARRRKQTQDGPKDL